MKLDSKSMPDNLKKESEQFQVDELAKRQKKLKRKGKKIISNCIVFQKNKNGTEEIKVFQEVALVKVQRQEKIRQKATKFQKSCDDKASKNLLPPPQITKKGDSSHPTSSTVKIEEDQNVCIWNVLPMCYYQTMSYPFFGNINMTNYMTRPIDEAPS